eukprot:scpid68817/ scgid25609/ Glycogenin-1
MMMATVETMRAKLPVRMLAITLLVGFTVIQIVLHWPLLSQAGKYTYQLLSLMARDSQRYVTETQLLGEMTWRLHKYELNFNHQTCKSQVMVKKKVAWLTAMVNDDFVVPAIALSYLLKKLSCYQDRIVMVSTGVSQAAQAALKQAGYKIEVVQPMDCDYMDKLKGRKPTGKGILGTHTRLQAWNLTQWDTLVYLDADFLPLSNMDELFTRSSGLSAPYCSRPGIADPCFNAGLLVFHPHREVFQGLMNYWSKASDYSCPNDQILLWHYFADNDQWDPLPYGYDVRRMIYFPMKAYHFACCLRPKPWHYPQVPNRHDAFYYDGPIDDIDDFAMVWWRSFYRAVDEFHLDEWWTGAQKSLAKYRSNRSGL